MYARFFWMIISNNGMFFFQHSSTRWRFRVKKEIGIFFMIAVVLLFNTSKGWALPPCPEDSSIEWSNCTGTVTSENGSQYTDEWKDDLPRGQGVATHTNGEKYVGEWGCDECRPDAARHGQGIAYYPNGDTYEGEWRGGEPTGQGTYTFANGDKFQGWDQRWIAYGAVGRGIPVDTTNPDTVEGGANAVFIKDLKDQLPLAEQGNAEAQFKVGMMYSLGHGVSQDYARAHSWLTLAVQHGYGKAKDAQIDIENKMSSAQIMKAEKLRENQIGNCIISTINKITGTRGYPYSDGIGTEIRYDYDLSRYHASYNQNEAVTKSKVGDPVRICLFNVPQNCPLDDDRGKVYRTTNARTNESWVMADNLRSCGGA
jgi:hypothetical protein